MTAADGQVRERQRLEALGDLRRRLHRSAVAMSMMPARELARHLGLPDPGMAEKLLQDSRLTQRLYIQLVDDDHAPDIAAIPDHSDLRIMDSAQDFDNACESVDVMLALNGRGLMIPKEEVRELARRYGDARLKWAWAHRQVWLDKPGTEAGAGDEPAGQAPKPQPRKLRKADPRRLLLDHLSRRIPEISSWLGRTQVDATRKPSMSREMEITSRVVALLVEEAGQARHVR